jgi:hypothetical protein
MRPHAHRRRQLLAALRQGDASAFTLLERLAVHPGWNRQLVRTVLAKAMRAEQVWVSDMGSLSPLDFRPRCYTSDPARAAQKPAKAPPAPECTALNKTPAAQLQAIAISRRSALECVWGGA